MALHYTGSMFRLFKRLTFARFFLVISIIRMMLRIRKQYLASNNRPKTST